MKLIFPDNFLWGASTASYQIEGGVNQDGRGETIWDRFCRIPNKVLNNDNGNIACDHYNRYREDIAIMKQIGLQAYRFSIAWSRLFPHGHGKLNQQGMDFYSSLIDGLLEKDIKPVATLFHWDFPQALQDMGGWANRDTVYRFRDYSAAAVEKLGDRIKYWITLNEPEIFTYFGHWYGRHAPGIKDLKTALNTAHHLMLGHGETLLALRHMRNDLKCGISLATNLTFPASSAKEDLRAAEIHHTAFNQWFYEPVFKGQYPASGLDIFKSFLPDIHEKDMDVIKTPLDWLGINNYSRHVIKYNADLPPVKGETVVPDNAQVTDFNWEICPDIFYQTLKWVEENYHPGEIYVTENGASFADGPDKDKKIFDIRRINFLKQYISAAHRAIQDGVPLKGYFQWSLMDNFEWAQGYSQRFGIVYIDYKTRERIIKESGHWYAKVIEVNGIEE
ncbi:MAG: GH1 family beta-glucosidase [bacterium]